MPRNSGIVLELENDVDLPGQRSDEASHACPHFHKTTLMNFHICKCKDIIKMEDDRKT